MRRKLRIAILSAAACTFLSTAAKAQGLSHNELEHIFIYVLVCLLLICVSALITTKIIMEKQKNTQIALTDAQTGVGNYRYFIQNIEKLTLGFTNSLYYVAYFIIDSNYLQLHTGEASFNDIASHTARVLTSVSRNGDIVARITENGFAYAFEDTNELSAKKHIESIMTKLNQYTDVDSNTNRHIFYSAMYNLCESDNNAEVLIFNLRINCTKIVGSDTQLVVCDSVRMNSVREEQKLLERIERGFKNQEFKLFLQFTVDNKTKKITSAEALSRWEDPEEGLIPPSKYIGTMEQTGIISKLDYYMFERVCSLLEMWKNTDKKDISVSCNVTRITLSDKDFVKKITEICNKYSFDKNKLILEITEDTMVKDREIALQNVFECKNMGFVIALDDLGSGYTSLKNLCDYPIDIVKIDRDILLKSEDDRGKELIRGVIALAHNINLEVVCEGVETPAHEKFISASECDYVQGWYYSGVMPLKQCDEFIEEYNKKLVPAL